MKSKEKKMLDDIRRAKDLRNMTGGGEIVSDADEPVGEEAEDLLFDHAEPAEYSRGDSTLPHEEYPRQSTSQLPLPPQLPLTITTPTVALTSDDDLPDPFEQQT